LLFLFLHCTSVARDYSLCLIPLLHCGAFANGLKKNRFPLWFEEEQVSTMVISRIGDVRRAQIVNIAHDWSES